MNENVQMAWSQLLKDKYWSRVWIIQELLLAQDISILWGDQKIPRDVFREVADSKKGLISWLSINPRKLAFFVDNACGRGVGL